MDALEKIKSFAINMPYEAAEEVRLTGPSSERVKELEHLKARFPVTQACLPNGQTIPLLKTMQTSVCENNCNYCVFRSGRDMRRASLTPDDMAAAIVKLSDAGIAKGVFLSSGIVNGGIPTQDRIIATAEILRQRYHYPHYIHLKIMPGAEKDQIFRAMQLADRVSINLEGPNETSLNRLAPRKVFLDQLLRPLKIIEQIRQSHPAHLAWKGYWPSSCTQFVVGAVGETDLDLLQTTDNLRTHFKISRAYFSNFSPVLDTPFENLPPSNVWRMNRLYQAFYLLRDYKFSLEDIQFSSEGHLDLKKDPKLAWAEEHLEHQPIEVNTADYEQLIKIPGIGPQMAHKIILSRRYDKIRDISDLRKFGASAKRAARFILLDGRKPAYQAPLFNVH
jgi:predicted DNA-binding helix-hairpin-helix protein